MQRNDSLADGATPFFTCIETPAKGRRGCSGVTELSPTAQAMSFTTRRRTRVSPSVIAQRLSSTHSHAWRPRQVREPGCCTAR